MVSKRVNFIFFKALADAKGRHSWDQIDGKTFVKLYSIRQNHKPYADNVGICNKEESDNENVGLSLLSILLDAGKSGTKVFFLIVLSLPSLTAASNWMILE